MLWVLSLKYTPLRIQPKGVVNQYLPGDSSSGAFRTYPFCGSVIEEMCVINGVC